MTAAVTTMTSPAPTLRGSAVRFAPGALAPAAFSIIGAAVFTRLFEPAAYGRYALALAACATLVAIATQWLQQGVLRFVPAHRDAAAADATRRGVVLAVLLLGAAAAAAGLLGHAALPRIGADWRPLLTPAAVLVTAGVMYQSIRAVLQAELRSTPHSAFQAALAAGGFLLAWAGALLRREPAMLLWGVALITLALVPVAWRTARLPAPAKVLANARAAARELRPLAVYGAPMVGWFAATMTFDLGDRVIIELLRGADAVGIYSASFALTAGAAGLVVLPLNLAMHPLLMRSLAAGETLRAGELMTSLWNTLLVAAAVLVGWSVLAAPYVADLVLGSAFFDGFRIIPVVLAGKLLWQLGMVAHKPLEFAGRTRLLFAFGAAAAALNLLLNLYFVGRFGYVAAAYVTAACYAAYVGAVLVAGRRALAWPLDARFSVATSLVALIGFGTAHRLAAAPGLATAAAAGVAAVATTLLLAAPGTPWAAGARLPWRAGRSP